MKYPKCNRCDLPREGNERGCHRCGGDVFVIEQGPWSSALRYVGMFFAGFAAIIVSVVVWVLLSYTQGYFFLILFIGMALAGLTLFFGWRFPDRITQVTVATALPYGLIEGYTILTGLLFVLDPQYDGHYWDAEFFLLPAILYASPIALCSLGALAGARRSFELLSILVIASALTFIGIASIKPEDPATRTSMFTYDLVDDENAHLSVDVKCDYTPRKNYWGFMDLTRGDCADTKVNVISKRPGLSLPTDAFWTYDGKEEHVTMWPMNRPNDTGAIDCFKPGCYDEIRRWSMWFSYAKIARAEQVSFKWGELRVDFGDKQFESMRLFRESVKQLTTRPTLSKEP